MKTLLIIPAYNEAENILSVVKNVTDAGYDYIVINDGSTDETLDICRSHGLRHLNLRQNLGIGGAVQLGHKYALENDYDVDVQFDGDGQHDVRYVEKLLEGIKQGADLVIGSRFVEKTDGFQSSLMRRVGIHWLNFWIKVFSGKKVTDPTSGFRACGRKAIALYSHDYPVDYPEPESIVVALRSGLKIQEKSVIMHERIGGTSSIRALSSVYYMIKVSIAIAIASITKRKR